MESVMQKPCANCSAAFTPKRPWALFCSPACKRAHHSRQLARGHSIATLAQAWRLGKHGGGEDSTFAYREMCALLDRYNAEDKAAGRSARTVVAAKRESGWAACDAPALEAKRKAGIGREAPPKNRAQAS